MNLTRFNFFQNLPLIKKTIQEANYVAIDFELTGVLASPLLRNSLLDSVLWKLISFKWGIGKPKKMSGDFSLFKWESAHLRNKMMSLLHTPIISTFFPLGSTAT
jgi:hypothetical protein